MPLTQTMFTGMDMDTSYTLRNQKKYFKLRNGTLTIDEELGVGTVSNSNGTSRTITLPASIVQPATVDSKSIPSDSNHVVIGASTVDEYIVLFSTNVANVNHTAAGTGLTKGAIWALKYDDDDDSIVGGIADAITDVSYVLDCDVHLKFYDYLDFFTDSPIISVGNSESDTRKKVYFTDGVTSMRTINIAEELVENTDLDHLSLVENVVFEAPTCKVIPGGQFYPGSVQYSYQLFTYGGSETTVSPASSIMNISDEDYNLSSSYKFHGTEYVEDETPTSKAVKVTVNEIDDAFEYIRILRIYFKTEYAQPEIDIIAEFRAAEGEEVTFVDNGDTTLGSISQQEYQSIGGVIFSAKDLATSNNRLIAANISEEFYNPTWDAKAYRYTSGGIARIDDSGSDHYIVMQTTGTWEEFDGTGTSTGVTGAYYDFSDELPNFDPIIDDQDGYAYDKTGIRGGTGANVSYTFVTQKMFLDNGGFPQDPGAAWYWSGSVARDPSYVIKQAPNATNLEQKWATGTGTAPNEKKNGAGWIDNTGEYANYSSAINSSLLASHQRGETYRYGIIFFDKKGRNSFVKWIGDIKFPEIYDSDTYGGSTAYQITQALIDSTGDGTVLLAYSYALGIQFEIENTPKDAVSYQIVRVPKEEADRTIVANGYITPVASGGWDVTSSDKKYNHYYPPSSMFRHCLQSVDGNKWQHRSGAQCWSSLFGDELVLISPNPWLDDTHTVSFPIQYSDRLFNFFCPEIAFYKNIETTGLTMKLLGFMTTTASTEFNIKHDPSEQASEFPYNLFFKSMDIEEVTEANSVEIDLESSVVITTETKNNFISVHPDESYMHSYNQNQTDSYTNWHKDRYWRAQGGSGLVGYSESSMSTWLGTQADDYKIPYVQLRRSITPYGGQSLSARRTSKYEPVSGLNSMSDSTVDVYQGDAYISMFEHTRVFPNHPEGSLDWTDRDGGDYSGTHYPNKNFMNAVCFPVESTINCDWRTDLSYTQASHPSRMLMRETKGSWDDDRVIFNQPYDSYTMNWTYMKPYGISLFTEEPLYFSELETELSHRIMASDAKFDGELADSWLKFKPNNFTDVNGENGPVIAIEAIGENLYFFQRKGIGITKVDERALVNDSDGVSLVLGTGDIFGKHRYVSDNTGVLSPRAIIKGRQGIYFYDYINKTISVLNNSGAGDLARLTGVRTYIKNNFDKDLSNTHVDVIAGFDQTTDMVYFSFLNEYTPVRVNDDYTIGYSEVVKDFTSLYDFAASGFISDRTRFLSWGRSNAGLVHMHNVGNKGEFYETEFDTVLTLLISDEPAITKVFDGIEYTHDVTEVNNYTPPTASQTFSRVRCYNNFLDTGLIATAPKFRFRTWRFKFPRITGLKPGDNGHRIIGKYLKIDLEFDNSTNNELYLQPTMTTWRPIAFIQP